jgi:uncharacterized caspase-like protein
VAEHSAERRDWLPGPFLAHLNRRHPDTVLFLARHLTGDEQQLTDAQLLRVQGTHLLIEVTRTDGSKTLPVPLTVAVASRSELVNQLARILRAAREASPDEPLTSLELVVSGHDSGGTPCSTTSEP